MKNNNRSLIDLLEAWRWATRIKKDQ